MYQQTFRKCEYEKSLRVCDVLDSDRYVYHDVASESGMGRYTDDRLSCAGIPAVLLLSEIPYSSR